MRKKQQKQMPLIEPASGHPQEIELEVISLLIDNTPTICDYVLQDLNRGKGEKQNTGAQGMSADQVIRAAVVMRLYSFTYEQLAFHIYDSRALRRFCRIGIADKGFENPPSTRISKDFPRIRGNAFPETCWNMPKTKTSRKVARPASIVRWLKAISISPLILFNCSTQCGC